MVIFTSGTTGPSKGCVLSHRYAVRQAQLMIEHFGLRTDDVLYCPFPLFHLDATVLTVDPGAGARARRRPSASGSRPPASGTRCGVFGATVFDFMGATLTMLHKRPPAPDDTDNPVRLGWGVPLPEFAPEFEVRFGVRLVEAYGSTDAGVPIYQPLDEPRRPGSCGRAIPPYDVEGVRRAGHRGRRRARWASSSSARSSPRSSRTATTAARGHDRVTAQPVVPHRRPRAARRRRLRSTSSAGRTDSIRRRGENISAFEVEEVVKLHPQVLDAAAYGVPSELSEDDVMVAVVRPSRRRARPGRPDRASAASGWPATWSRATSTSSTELPAHADREGREGGAAARAAA